MSHRVFLTAAAIVLVSAVSLVGAQSKAKTQTTTGPVAKMDADLMTVDTGKGPMVFVTSAATKVKVTGGSSKANAAKAAGEKGVKISDAVHVGDQVSVKYTEADGKMVASEVDVLQRRPASALPPKK
jgi:predicted peroxiredoxin